MSRLYALLALPVVDALAATQTPCDQLKLSLPETSVTSIQFVPAGPFVAPNAVAAPAAAQGSWRKAAPVPRLGRSGYPARSHGALL